MDQRTGENLWLGTNGHSNSTLGGTFIHADNIFDYTHGRPTPITVLTWSGKPQANFNTQVPDMAWMAQGDAKGVGGGYRGTDEFSGNYDPQITLAQAYGFRDYDWGATIDPGTVDTMYHQFSCSKCHNPHASRLPKLLITNCLDIQHNTWDENKSSLQNTYRPLTAVDSGKPAAYYASAQNCHRYDGTRSTETLKGGWNKVSPLTKPPSP